MNNQIALTRSNLLMMVVLLLPFLGRSNLAAQTIAGEDNLVKDGTLDYQYYDLACDVGAWEGYFAPEQWERIKLDKNDTSIQPHGVTMPFEHEGLTVLLKLESETSQVWSIEAPTPGYLSFSLVAESGAVDTPFRIMINDRVLPLAKRADGFSYSPFLKAGDRFSLLVPAGERVFYWNNLLFHSNYKAVVVRPEERDPRSRYTPIEASLIQRVFFLSEEPGSWPVFDQDGDLSTVDDQFELRGDSDRFKVSYRDEVEQVESSFMLSRTFTIREKCSRGSWLRSKRRWVSLPIIPE